MNMLSYEGSIQLAERTAAITLFLERNNIKLGNEGACAHFNEVAQLAVSTFIPYPSDFDWEDYIEEGGDCWDIVMMEYVCWWLDKHYGDNPPQWEK